MNGQTTVAISEGFFSAFAALPRTIQGKVSDFINKLRNNPASAALNYEQLNGRDKKIASVRIDDTYRGIVVRQPETNTYILLWVDHHDEAYKWAMNKICRVSDITGSVQVYEVQPQTVHLKEAEAEGQSPTPPTPPQPAQPQPVKGPFADFAGERLVGVGVPREQVDFVKGLPTVQAFTACRERFPTDTAEVLEWLANGLSIEDVERYLEDVKHDTGTSAGTEPAAGSTADGDLGKALRTDLGKSGFFIVKGEDELRRALAEPLEKWRIFLHPLQRRIAERSFKGPVRVLGSAGTGKTVVAMHHTRWLAHRLAEAGDQSRILFTTFTVNLARDIHDNLRKICTDKEMEHIEVVNLDAWVDHCLKEHGFGLRVASDNELGSVWEQALAQSGEDVGLTAEFFQEEWARVVVANDAFNKEAYLKASRAGRGTPIDRKKRLQVWNVFEEYQALMKEARQCDAGTAKYDCRGMITGEGKAPLYASVILDEAQDFDAAAYRLLRAIAGPEHADDLFIVGDAHQRIYKKRAALSKCGINVKGRSRTLRLNYRTTEETRRFAFALLKGIPFDDLDGVVEKDMACQSLTHGDPPAVKGFKTIEEEFQFINSTAAELTAQGVDSRDICITARTNDLLKQYADMFHRLGVDFLKIGDKGSKRSDDRTKPGVRLATMHRVKGLEFQYVFAASVNDRVLPLDKEVKRGNPLLDQEGLISEKCLLYVALTRARQRAFITSWGTPSPLLAEVCAGTGEKKEAVPSADKTTSAQTPGK